MCYISVSSLIPVLFICKTVSLSALPLLNSDDHPVIALKHGGSVRGTRMYTMDKKVPFHAFRHIPYAEPPIGALRFEPPLPAKPWSGTIDGTKDSAQCVQTVWLDVIKTKSFVHGVEDCLYLSFYLPIYPSNKLNLIPVMVYIHGGTFLHLNSSYQLHGPDYFLEQDVIFVSFNYRLGVFGFASTGDLDLPGNYGMKDQSLALKWVKENIGAFGGDPNRITIFGESAGAISVSYQVQSQLAKGLFHGGIMQSGTTLCIWSLSRKSQAVTRLLSLFATAWNFLTCQASRDCGTGGKTLLKSVDYRVLHAIGGTLEFLFMVFLNKNEGFVFGPVIEPEHKGAFFTHKSYEQLKSGNYNQVPTIIGFASKEAGHPEMATYLRVLYVKFDIYSKFVVPCDLNLNSSDPNLSIVRDHVKQYYWQGKSITFNINETLQFLSDDQFNRPIRKTVLLMANHTDVYYYRFAYIGLLGNIPNRPLQGVAHSEDLGYMFTKHFNSTASDRLTRKKIIKLWTNFAKFGKPTPFADPLCDNVIWTPAAPDTQNLRYLNIDAKLEMKTNPENRQMLFWDDLYAAYGKPPYDTY